jgi:hypothetical protein
LRRAEHLGRPKNERIPATNEEKPPVMASVFKQPAKDL